MPKPPPGCNVRRRGNATFDRLPVRRYRARAAETTRRDPRGAGGHVLMKLKVRRSKVKRLKKVGFRTRSKTAGGRKVIKRKIKRSGKFRVG